MKETWGFAWFATALCAIALVPRLVGHPDAGLIAFYCFIPVVFFTIARTIKELRSRVEALEQALERAGSAR